MKELQGLLCTPRRASRSGARRVGRACRFARRDALAATAFAVVLCLASAAQASPLDLFGFGGRSPALASTGVANATDYDAAFLNPAGLADAVGKRFTLGTMGGDLFLYRDDQRTATDRITSLVVGGALRLPLGGVMRDRIGLGFGFNIPTAAINRARHPLPGVPVHALLETRSQVVSVQAALGARITDRIQVGVGMMALAALVGQIDVTTDATGRFTSVSEQQMIGQVSPVVGVRYLMPEHDLNLGAVFRGVSRSDYDIVVSNELGEVLPVTIPTVNLAGASQYDPLTLALEAGWNLNRTLLLSGQLAYQRWSAYAQPTTNPVDGPGQEPLPDHGFHDIVIPKVAVEWQVRAGATQFDIRGGYQFYWSPAPEMTGLLSLLDNNRHIVSTGLGLAWPDTDWPVRLDLWVQMHALMPRRHEKDPSLFAADEEIPFDDIDTKGSIVVGGLTMGLQL